MSEHDDQVSKAASILKDQRLGMLVTVDAEDTLTSRPMALQEVEFDGDLWFFAEAGSRKTTQIRANPQVNVSAGDAATWISLSGHAEIVDDVEKKRQVWNAGVAAWLPQGPDDDSVTLIRVTADSAEYWDTAGGRVATLISFAKAKLTGERFEGRRNERVDL